jgi:DNA-binding CsgD family transcriptional regulator
VASVSERDVKALLDVAAELAGLDDPLPFPPRILERLAGLVGTGQAAYSELDRRDERSVAYVEWAEGDEVVEAGPTPADTSYWRLRHSHPLCSRRERDGDWTTPHTVSDFATLREFHGTEIWNEAYRPEGIDYWLDVGLAPRYGHTRVFVFVDGRHDFDGRAKLMLALLGPHLQRRADDAAVAGTAVDALAAVEEAAADEVHDVVLAGARGTIEFASARSRALLGRYFGSVDGRLPEALSVEEPVVARTVDGARLVVRIARVGQLRVLLLAEADVRVERLTPRQREILRSVADGLTDAQIGERLGIAAATVNKHLESIYARLDVHKRTAAAALLR